MIIDPFRSRRPDGCRFDSFRLVHILRKCGSKKAIVVEVLVAIAAIVAIWVAVVGPSSSARRNSEIAIDALAAYEPDVVGAHGPLNQANLLRPNNGLVLLANGLQKVQSQMIYEVTEGDDLTRAAERVKRDGRAHYLLGVVHMREHQLCKAMEEFRSSLRRQQSFAPSESQLGAAMLVAKYMGISCSSSQMDGEGVIRRGLGMLRSAVNSTASGGASLHYQLADSLMLVANMTVDEGRRRQYVEDAETALRSALARDVSNERKSRMMARWYSFNYSWKEARQQLESVQDGLWGVFDAAVLEWCNIENVTKVHVLLDKWENWSVEAIDMPALAEIRMHYIRSIIGSDDVARETGCDKIRQASSPLLWSASQAVAAMGEWTRGS